MTTNDRTEILSAVLDSRDSLGADLDDRLLEEIVDIETRYSDASKIEDGLRRAIDAAISRGIGANGGDQ